MSEEVKDRSESAASKEELELQKLRLEIQYSRRGFALQVANFITLISIALIVFYFFQRPQVQTMEASRVATEKHQVAQLLIAAQSISSDVERSRVLDMLADQYPHFVFVAKIAKTARTITEASAQRLDGDLPSKTVVSHGNNVLGGPVYASPNVQYEASGMNSRASIKDDMRDLQAQLDIERSRGRSKPEDKATVEAIELMTALFLSKIRNESELRAQRSVPAAQSESQSSRPRQRYEWLPSKTRPAADAAPVTLPPAVGLE